MVDDDLGGHAFILTTIDTAGQDATQTISVHVNPFLKVINHPSLLDCLSVVSFVGTMYATFGVPNGDRAIGFLESVCRYMINSHEQSNSDRDSVSLEMVNLALNTLYQLLRRVQGARLHAGLSSLLGSLHRLAHIINQEGYKADLDAVDTRIEVMRSVVANPNRSLLPPKAPEENTRGTGSVQSSFPMHMEIPGGRHDNVEGVSRAEHME